MVDVYFIIDIFLNFRTSYYTSDGTREDRPDKIAKAYLKGWFTIDFLSCLPLGYVGYFFQDNGTASAATAGSMAVAADGAKGDSTIRLLKVLRLVRLLPLRASITSPHASHVSRTPRPTTSTTSGA